jgi:hypothetical protein
MKVIILKSSIDLDKEIKSHTDSLNKTPEAMKDISNMLMGAINELKTIKHKSVEITDEDINKNIESLLIGPDDVQSTEDRKSWKRGFLDCWEYIKSKL